MADDDKDDIRAATAGDTMAAQMAMSRQQSPATEAYLEKHGRLLDLQIENLQKLDAFETSHLRWRRFRDQMSGVLQLSLALVGVIIVAAIVMAVWNARTADGVVIEAFSVPPDLAAKGITGPVVATQLQDKLSALQTATFSYRAPSTYANNWGDDIKVQIPDTGVSIGEFNRYLREWLGHETQITGEIWRTPDGIAVTARAGSAVSPTFTGADADLPKLIEQAAEAIYRATQPYRYSIYALQNGHDADARTVLINLSRDPSPAERAWAHVGLAFVDSNRGDDLGAIAEFRRALGEQPDFPLAHNDLANGLSVRGHDEEALALARKALPLGAGGGGVAVNPALSPTFSLSSKVNIASAAFDPLAVLSLDRQLRALNADTSTNIWENAGLSDLVACGLMHDRACLHDVWSKFDLLDSENPMTAGFTSAVRAGARGQAEQSMNDWPAALRDTETAAAGFAKASKAAFPDVYIARSANPAAAIDYANLGNIAKAKSLVATVPLDCTICLFARGVVAERSGNPGAAAYWFARADAFGPSFPLVPVEWGRMLLASGGSNGAIAKFAVAAHRSPHFADPLEGWGEALMRQNRSDLALVKFTQANTYAPNWGRLHLKWGEALHYTGKDADAKKHFAIAASCFLTNAEKAELTKMTSHG